MFLVFKWTQIFHILFWIFHTWGLLHSPVEVLTLSCAVGRSLSCQEAYGYRLVIQELFALLCDFICSIAYMMVLYLVLFCYC